MTGDDIGALVLMGVLLGAILVVPQWPDKPFGVGPWLVMGAARWVAPRLRRSQGWPRKIMNVGEARSMRRRGT